MQNLPAGISPHKPGNLPILRSPKSKKDHEVAMGFSLQKKLWNNHNSSLQNKLFRWLRTFNVTTASHARQRKVADEWSGDDLIIEVAPFQSDVCDDTGHYEICSASWGYIDNLPLHIMNRLDELERYFFFPEKFIYWCKIYILWKHLNFLINFKNWWFKDYPYIWNPSKKSKM